MGEIVLTDALGAPKRSHNAQMHVKIVFWHNPEKDHILQGAPENFDPPAGYLKIVCNHAAEAELWSKRLREQDKRFAEMEDMDREGFEGPMRQHLRQETIKLMNNPPLGIDERHKRVRYKLLEMSLKALDQSELRAKTVRESFLHSEAFEAGK